MKHFGLFQLLGTPDLRYFGAKHTFRMNSAACKQKSKIRHRPRVFDLFLLAAWSARNTRKINYVLTLDKR